MILHLILTNSFGQTPLSTGGGSTEETGVVLNTTSFSSLTGYTVSSGTTATVSSGAVALSGGSSFSDASKYVQYDGFIDADEKIKVNIDFTLSAAGNGIGIRKKTVNTWNTQDLCATANLNTGKAELWNYVFNGSAPLATASSAVTVAVGNTYRLTLEVAKKTFIVTLENLTTSQTSTVTYTHSNRYNTSKFQWVNFGGTQTITAFKVERKSLKFADLICLGDSKTEGAVATAVANRYTDLLASTTGKVVETGGGAGDRTVELINNIAYIIAAAPTRVMICMGRNDLGSGVATATWQANYDSAVTQLKAAGIQVIHLMPIPETSLSNQSAINSYINSTYPSDMKIDISSGWSNSTMLSGDAVHPNNTGHTHIAAGVKAALGW